MHGGDGRWNTRGVVRPQRAAGHVLNLDIGVGKELSEAGEGGDAIVGGIEEDVVAELPQIVNQAAGELEDGDLLRRGRLEGR